MTVEHHQSHEFQGLRIRAWAIPIILTIGTSLGGIWWSLNQGLQGMTKEFSDFKGDMKASNAVMESQMKTVNNSVKRLEGRIDVDNQTRYTVGEARRDFAIVDRKLDDHESRIRALEKKDRP